MSFLKEFKEFAIRGNVVDMAVGVVIGGAFGKIVSSLVADVIMPLTGAVIGGLDFKELKFILVQAQGSTPAVTVNYGLFIQSIIDFMIIAFAIFVAIRLINKLRTPAADAVPEPTAQEALLSEIRDLLKEANK